MSVSPQRSAIAAAVAVVIAALGAPSTLAVTLSGPSTTSQSLSGSDSLSIAPSGTLSVSGDPAVDLSGATTGAGVTVTNQGLITSDDRAIDSDGAASAIHRVTIVNAAGATIDSLDDAVRFKANYASGSLTLTNSGTLRSSEGRALSLDKLRSANWTTTLTNTASGVIASELEDGMKTGANATILNYGNITSGAFLDPDTKPDGIDIDSATGVRIYNYASGTISGGRHGITTDEGAYLYNEGLVIGRNGSGFGSDNDGTVINHGTITGAVNGLMATGDGDGVDIDKLASIVNYGTIEGTGAVGDGNNSEGIAAGGGSLYNAAGALISGATNGVLIDDGNQTSAYYATTLENHGLIQGVSGYGVKMIGEFADTVINSGAINGGDGLALDLGGGDDSLAVLSGGTFAGTVDGGSGVDSLTLSGEPGGSFGDSRNFERLTVASGNWTLQGSGDFSQGGTILTGASLVNLSTITGAVTVAEGGRYTGGGSVGGLQVDGVLETGTTWGSAQVNGNLAFGSTGSLAYGVNPDGTSAPLIVSGTATLNGAALNLVPAAGDYPWKNRYVVLRAGAIDGTFASVTSDYAFLTPTLSYTPTQVELQYNRNDVQFARYARSANAAAAASAVSLTSAGALYDAVLNTSSGSAGTALEQLAGGSTANLSAATLAGTAQVGSSMLSAMRALGSSGGLLVGLTDTEAPYLAAVGVPASARNLNDPNAQGRLWLQGLGSYGKLDGSHGSDATEQRSGGAVLGADWSLNERWRLGVLGGYSHTRLSSSGAEGDIDSLHLGVYASRVTGPWAVRLGAAYSLHDGNSQRSVAFSGFTDRPKGDYHADSQQAFAELAYATGSGRLEVEPFVGLNYQRYQRDGYREKGGAAALAVDSTRTDNLSYSLGLRIANLATLDSGMSLTPRASLAWRHTYGSLSDSTRQSFLSGASAFSVEGSALDRDSLLAEAGVDVGLGPRSTLGVGYSGEYGANSRLHALVGQWQLHF